MLICTAFDNIYIYGFGFMTTSWHFGTHVHEKLQYSFTRFEWICEHARYVNTMKSTVYYN